MKKLTGILLILILCVSAVLGYMYFTYEKLLTGGLTVTLTGDLYYDKNFTSWIEENAFEDYFDQVQPLLKTDLVIGNLVQTIGVDSTEEEGETDLNEFPNSYLETLASGYKGIGFDFFTCANMQSRRKGLPAIEHTIDVLDQYKIGHTGIYKDEKEQAVVSIAKAKDAKVAVLSYTTKVYDSRIYDEDEEDRTYDVNVILDEDGNLTSASKKKIRQDVQYGKEKADVVVVAVNWGDEYTYNINQTQIIITNYLNSLGVDIVLGNHPHISQRADILTNANGEKTYVFYSMGSFINARCARPGEAVDETGVNMAQVSSVIQFDLEKGEEGYEMENVKVIPVVNHYEPGFTNFKLIPLSEYTNSLASKHAQSQFTSSFTTDWLWNEYHFLYDNYNLLSEETINEK